MKTYRGFRSHTCDGGRVVVVIGADGATAPLDLRTDLANHSPTGFEWGYGGAGPAQLALALLADALGDDAAALRLHQRFKSRVVCHLMRDQSWTLTIEDIRMVAREVAEEMGFS